MADNTFAKPKPKVTQKDNILAKHKFVKSLYLCDRCGNFSNEIEAEKLECISEARFIGNAAIHRITRG